MAALPYMTNLVSRMVKAGATPELILIAVEAAESGRGEIESRRKSDRERKARQRSMSQDNSGTVTGQETESPKPVSLDKEKSPHTPLKETKPFLAKKESKKILKKDDTEFETWWLIYPNKVGKGAAQKAWVFVRSRFTVSLETLNQGVERYIREKPPDRAWCNPATWLNQQRWLDEPGPEPNGGEKGYGEIVRDMIDEERNPQIGDALAGQLAITAGRRD